MEMVLIMCQGKQPAKLYTYAAGEGSAAALVLQPSGSVESQRSHRSQGLARDSEGAPATSLALQQDLVP